MRPTMCWIRFGAALLLTGCLQPQAPSDAGTLDPGIPDAGSPDAGSSDAGSPVDDGGFWDEPLPPLPVDMVEGLGRTPAGLPIVVACSSTGARRFTPAASGWVEDVPFDGGCGQVVMNGTALILVGALPIPNPTTWPATSSGALVAVTGEAGLAVFTPTALPMAVSTAATSQAYFGGRAVVGAGGAIFAVWIQAKRVVTARFADGGWEDLDSAFFNAAFQEYPPGLVVGEDGLPIVVAGRLFRWNGAAWSADEALAAPPGVLFDYVVTPLAVRSPAGAIVVAWTAKKAGVLRKPLVVTTVADAGAMPYGPALGGPDSVALPRGLWFDAAGRLWLAYVELDFATNTVRMRFLRARR